MPALLRRCFPSAFRHVAERGRSRIGRENSRTARLIIPRAAHAAIENKLTTTGFHSGGFHASMLLASSIVLTSWSGAAFGQTADPVRDAASADIVVTARLREEPAREVPFAVDVLGAETLAARRIDDTQSLFRQIPACR